MTIAILFCIESKKVFVYIIYYFKYEKNIKFSKDIIQKQDVLILTSQTHAKRACAIARQFFSDYGCMWFKDLKPKHIAREIVSRILYIKIEFLKKIGRY